MNLWQGGIHGINTNYNVKIIIIYLSSESFIRINFSHLQDHKHVIMNRKLFDYIHITKRRSKNVNSAAKIR